MAAIITLISDMGTSGYYVAGIKASILSGLPSASIVDITHGIRPFNILDAAFVLGNVYHKFPAGTVHLVSVDSEKIATRRYMALQADGHHFVGPDNGLFSLALAGKAVKAVELSAPAGTLTATELVAKAASQLANGTPFESLGRELSDWQRQNSLQPTYDTGSITTQIVYIDEYGNCFCNLDRKLFEQVAANRRFVIDIKGYEVETISKDYTDAASGEIVALFSSSGLLELAMTHGNLAQILGLERGERGDSIKIIFTE